MSSVLSLTDDQLHGLAVSRPSAETLRILEVGQVSKRRLLLIAIRRELAGRGEPGADAAFALIDRASHRAPAAVNEVLARPLIGAWAIRALTALRRTAGPIGDAAVGFSSSIAAAAAARADLDFEIGVPAPGGTVVLPSVGLAAGLTGDIATVRGDGTNLSITSAGSTVEPTSWQALRVIRVDRTHPWDLEIDDQDPYRDCFGHRIADRLDAHECAHLADLIHDAWAILQTDHPTHAAVARASLRSLVPLAGSARNAGVDAVLSASSRHAFGCVAVAVPHHAPALAMAIVHELQHMILGGVLDLVDLYEDGGSVRHQAAWRLDPRPVGALLQGAYAHVGVTDFWRACRRRAADGTADRFRADFEFAFWREVTTRAIHTLAGSGELTVAGLRFVAGMASTAENWWLEPVPRTVGMAARDVADAETVLWRILNQQPAPDDVGRLSRARETGSVCDTLSEPVIQPRPAAPTSRRGLSATIRDHALAPLPRPPADRDTIFHGDRALVEGDLTAAARAYRERIREDPSDDEAWVGLALALRRLGAEPAAGVLSERPEVVRALYAQEWAGTDLTPATLTPDKVAAWLATGFPDGTPAPYPRGDRLIGVHDEYG